MPATAGGFLPYEKQGNSEFKDDLQIRGKRVGDTWVTDIGHFLDGRGEFPHDLPGPALNLASHIADIILATTSRKTIIEKVVTDVKCRRRPGRKKCVGVIESLFEPDLRIRWFCPVCGDNGYISGWRGTKWDRAK